MLRIVESLQGTYGLGTFDTLEKVYELARMEETIGGTMGTIVEGLG